MRHRGRWDICWPTAHEGESERHNCQQWTDNRPPTATLFAGTLSQLEADQLPDTGDSSADPEGATNGMPHGSSRYVSQAQPSAADPSLRLAMGSDHHFDHHLCLSTEIRPSAKSLEITRPGRGTQPAISSSHAPPSYGPRAD